MANSSINLASLDFQSIKDDLKSYLKANTVFKDYDYDGSNIGTLLDVLAYNTSINAFYLNMVMNEMFLDTAQMRDSVLSHAKELNYLPRSFRSSTSVVDIEITPSYSTPSITIPKGTTFTSRVGSNTYTFSTSEAITTTATDSGTFIAANTSLYEGIYVSDSFVMNSSDESQRFILTNPRIDTNSITVATVSRTGTVQSYNYAASFFGVTSESKVFFVQPAENERYEILFGDNATGYRPADGETIVVDYRVSSGELPNGASVFDPNSSIAGHTGVSVTTVAPAAGGAVSESIQSIRFNAPRHYQTQQRAVTASDYKTLLLAEFPEIKAVAVYGGEEADPPRFGSVVVAVTLYDTDGSTAYDKERYRSFIKTKTPVSIQPFFVDPEILYVYVNARVVYNVNVTSLTINDMRARVQAAISTYNTNSLQDFDKTLYYSKLVSAIDNADSSILSNDTTLQMYKKINPLPSMAFTGQIDFGNELSIQFTGSSSAAVTNHPASVEHTLSSTIFTYDGKRCSFEDDGNGNLIIVTTVNDEHIVVKSSGVGSVNYTTGVVQITDVLITGYEGGSIKIYANPAVNDVSAIKNNLIEIDTTNININIVATRAS